MWVMSFAIKNSIELYLAPEKNVFSILKGVSAYMYQWIVVRTPTQTYSKNLSEDFQPIGNHKYIRTNIYWAKK